MKYIKVLLPSTLIILLCYATYIVGSMAILEVAQAKRQADAELPNNGIIFVWNDDEESIPKDGSLIRIEFTDENTVYIGPAE